MRYGNPISNQLQVSACEKVYEIFNDDKYKEVVENNESCQYMYLNVVWLLNNRQPIFAKGECWITKMGDDAWRELLLICNNYIGRFCVGNNMNQVAMKIRYIRALCLGQLERYSESLAALKEIEEDSSLGRDRVLTKHMLCDKNGIPKKFVGRLGRYFEVERNGVLYIDEFGKTPIYYFGPHLNTSRLEEGTVFTDIEIGYGYIEPKAFRNVENEE